MKPDPLGGSEGRAVISGSVGVPALLLPYVTPIQHRGALDRPVHQPAGFGVDGF
jgi:hypothetical protein